MKNRKALILALVIFLVFAAILVVVFIFRHIKTDDSNLPMQNAVFIDLDGDGIKTTSIRKGIFIDYQNDSFGESTSWADKDDGIFIINKNNDWYIDGFEIFGNNYIKSNGKKAKNGFDALSDLDSNKDGLITPIDKGYNRILIMKGKKKYLTLKEAGVILIDLNRTIRVRKKDKNGNILVKYGNYIKSDGTEGTFGEIYLKTNKIYAIETRKVGLSNEVRKLPYVPNYGTAHSLQQAIMLDISGELKQLVKDFIASNDSKTKKDIVDKILLKWSGVDTIKISKNPFLRTWQKARVVRKFMGGRFIGNADDRIKSQSMPLFDGSYRMIADYIYYKLAAQTDEDLKRAYNLTGYYYNPSTDRTGYTYGELDEYIDWQIKQDEKSGKKEFSKISKMIAGLGWHKEDGYDEYYDYHSQKGLSYRFLMRLPDKRYIKTQPSIKNVDIIRQSFYR